MRSGWKDSEEQNHHIFWPSVADMAVATCIVLVVLWMSQIILLRKEKESTEISHAQIVELQKEVERLTALLDSFKSVAGVSPKVIAEKLARLEILEAEREKMEEELRKKQIAMDELLAELKNATQALDTIQKNLKGLSPEDLHALVDKVQKLSDKPPIIQIEDKGNYRFESGKSEISGEFAMGLSNKEFVTLADEIVRRDGEKNLRIDTLEIIGHTDGKPVPGSENLDSELPKLLSGDVAALKRLTPGSNNDLGLLRALAVKLEWRKFIETHPYAEILARIDVRCYSAGQTILPESRINPNREAFERADSSARRIEMRLTRLGRAS